MKNQKKELPKLSPPPSTGNAPDFSPVSPAQMPPGIGITPATARRIELRGQLDRLRADVDRLKKDLCFAMYVDDFTEAAKLMDDLRNETHVQALREKKVELEFLRKRAGQLEAALNALAVEVMNG